MRYLQNREQRDLERIKKVIEETYQTKSYLAGEPTGSKSSNM
jgi:hypothetical protein